MSYREAKRLRPGDEVTVKAINKVCRVVEVDSQPDIKMVFVKCDSGRWYHHVAIAKGRVDCSKDAIDASILSAIGKAIVNVEDI